MFPIDVPSAASSRPAPAAVGTPGYFSDGDPETATPPTTMTSDWANMVQEELVAVVVDGGGTVSKTTFTQVRDAVRAMISTAIDGLTSAIDTVLNGKVDKTTTVSGGGLAIGGGALSANQTITVLGASSAEITAGAIATKAITPQALAAAFAGTIGAAGSVPLFGGLILKWGLLPLSGSGSNVIVTTLTFPVAFPNNCFCVIGNADGPASGTWHPIVVISNAATLSPAGVDLTADTANVSEHIVAGRNIFWIALGD